ncbi:hypothetical protein QBC45DRAFT_158980 [Copromyces sp. CBS 386.78]|nr:hypothetical protein QBC45DRAFT_158980 [Copromyces sp. CBS 386.78]
MSPMTTKKHPNGTALPHPSFDCITTETFHGIMSAADNSPKRITILAQATLSCGTVCTSSFDLCCGCARCTSTRPFIPCAPIWSLDLHLPPSSIYAKVLIMTALYHPLQGIQPWTTRVRYPTVISLCMSRKPRGLTGQDGTPPLLWPLFSTVPFLVSDFFSHYQSRPACLSTSTLSRHTHIKMPPAAMDSLTEVKCPSPIKMRQPVHTRHLCLFNWAAVCTTPQTRSGMTSVVMLSRRNNEDRSVYRSRPIHRPLQFHHGRRHALVSGTAR